MNRTFTTSHLNSTGPCHGQ